MSAAALAALFTPPHWLSPSDDEIARDDESESKGVLDPTLHRLLSVVPRFSFLRRSTTLPSERNQPPNIRTEAIPTTLERSSAVMRKSPLR